MFKAFSKYLVMSLLILTGLGQISQAEEAKAPPPPKWYDTINVSGFVDAYYSYNFNGQSGQNLFHNFDLRTNDFDINLVELNIVKPVDDKNKVGFYLGLAFGPTADWIASGGSSFIPAAESPYKNFRQAYASMLLLPNLQLDFGKFVTQHGAEVIETKDNWNYTRSLLFSWAIPYYHSGARLTYTLNDMVYIQGNITNGWNNVVETNNGKTYGVQLGITPVKPLPIVINYMTGPELIPGSATVSDTRSLFDIVATYNVTDSLSLMANYDNATQKQGQGVGLGDAKWSGYALYGRYAFASSWAVVLRYESLKDDNNFLLNSTSNPLLPGPAVLGSATSQTVQEGTLTLEYVMVPGSIIRLDLRQDKSDSSVFTKEDRTKTDTQNTITLGIVQTF